MIKKVLKGKMIRIYPNKSQQTLLAKTFGCNRFLWNQMLDMQNARYNNCSDAKFVSTFGMNYLLPCLKVEHPWLKDVDSLSLQQTNSQLNQAFVNFWNKRACHPHFKSKRYEQTYQTSNACIVDEHHLKLPKLGKIYFRSSSVPKGVIKSATVRLKASGKYYVSLLIETEVEEKVKTNKSCGCDLGLKELLILDNGHKMPLPRFDKELEDKLRYWQRLSSRRLLKAKEVMEKDKTKRLTDFKNYQKARQMVAKYHEKIANQRYDYLQKLSTWLVEQHDVIVLEDLKTKMMLKNHKLARAISNAGWNKFIQMISYKCEWYGKEFVQVNAKYTSQTCHACGCVNGRLGYDRFGWLKVREWECVNCGTRHDRDINAAINIKEKGLTLL